MELQVEAIMDHQSGMSNQSFANTKIERRIVEKNRRNQMKILYSKLNSLLPPHSSKEVQTLPDQIDEAIKYIKSLESNIRKLNEKKNSLLPVGPSSSSSSRKRPYVWSDNSNVIRNEIEIKEIILGSVIEVILITSLDNNFIFYEIIRILTEEKADLLDAKLSVAGDSVFHILHAQIGDSIFGATKISERLKRFVNGSSSDVELQREWWEDFEIQPESLEWI